MNRTGPSSSGSFGIGIGLSVAGPMAGPVAPRINGGGDILGSGSGCSGNCGAVLSALGAECVIGFDEASVTCVPVALPARGFIEGVVVGKLGLSALSF